MQIGQKTTLTQNYDVYHFSVSLAFFDIHLVRRRISRVAPSAGIPWLRAGREQHWDHSRYRSWFVTIIVCSSFTRAYIHLQAFLTKETSCPRLHSTSTMLGMSYLPYFSFRALTVQNAEMAVISRHSSSQSYVFTSCRTIKEPRFYEIPSKYPRSGRKTSLGLPSTRLGISSAKRSRDVTHLFELDQGMRHRRSVL